MTKTFWGIAIAVSLAMSCIVRVHAAESETRNEQFRIVGQVTADEKSAERAGFDDLSIGFTSGSPDAVVWIGVVTAQGDGEDGFRGKELLDAVDGYDPNLLAVGEADVVAKLRNVAVGSRVDIRGVVDAGARTYLIASVGLTPPASK